MLADFILSDECGLGNEVYVTKGHECFYHSLDPSLPTRDVPDLLSYQKEADPLLAFHTICSTSKYKTCVVSLLISSLQAKLRKRYFGQWHRSSEAGITYNNVISPSWHLGEAIARVNLHIMYFDYNRSMEVRNPRSSRNSKKS